MPTVLQVLTAAQGHLAAGREEAAATLASSVLRAFPDQADAWHLLGLSKAAGDGLSALTKAVRLVPGNAVFQLNRAIAARDQRGLWAAVALAPGDAELLANVGLHVQRAGRYVEAGRLLRLAFRLRPSSDALGGGLDALVLRGLAARCLDGYGLLCALDPTSAQAYFGLSQAYNARNLNVKARRAILRHLAFHPARSSSWRYLGELLFDFGDVVAARRALWRVIAIDPDDNLAAYMLNQWHLVLDDLPAARFLFERRVWSRRHAEHLTRAAPPHDNDRDPDRPLVVGYLGGATFRATTHTYNVFPPIAAHDPAVTRLIFYSDLGRSQEDDWTGRYAALGEFRRTLHLDDEALARAIRRDKVDVLMDLVSHLGGHRALMVARRPAPVQGTMAHVCTSGMTAHDFALVDRFMIEGAGADQFVERPELVPCGYNFVPIKGIPDAAPPPSLTTGVVTFGSLNALFKITPRCADLWARVMRAVPGSRLLLKGKMFIDPAGRAAFARRFEALGVSADRLDLRPWSAGFVSHMGTYDDIDVGLDTFPYVGITTTLEAMWKGVPVVTLAGEKVVERYGVTIMEAVGRPRDVAHDGDGFVARAVELANAIEERVALRHTLRDVIRSSPLGDGRLFAGAMEEIMRRHWRRWCAT